MIITSLLDTDLYKFTMMQVVLHHFPAAQVEYRYKCRTPNINLAAYLDEIREEVHQLCQLRFTEPELQYLRSLRFIKSDFVDFLGLFHLPEKCISITESKVPGEIDISVKGPWLHTILFEIPVLAIVNEVYFRNVCREPGWEEGRKRLQEKMRLVIDDPALADFRVAEYGTRRRFSKVWHDEVVTTMKNQMGVHFAGTSNVELAMKHNVTPLGTMAHEYLQACQALGPRLRDSQVFALEVWAKEYRGDLGIALSDVYGMDAFLRDFDMYFCKLFDGARHDSGDPFVWGERLLEHYARNRTDPRTKILVFSDALTIPRAIELAKHFAGRCKISFGIGTNLTNDLGHEPLQIVMKMVRCNGQPVAKVSDAPEKTMCDDPAYLAYLRQVFQLPPA
ncbi:nicotinate phosphoribosyltransferase [Parapusillimonas granuli]|uniref:Nicotinate phosphoribosyltransferase n=1 Tax=Parapusillimonas granuli TaxID=380911 RepID=A0A853G611_9BURK|nr:nicotinate phosphoribosyltransferase [Parapusillimonas granuli]MBB5216749.1 nicotinate phosphoribosyltransferase [Parapusillimonas granuli]MEB2400078.1 nicotinate phosphoribosyltransferase [Alcaligenaceae bacterium]NYT51607.1 nicotinate phosphoribosyltransferase [Parapusillimonas granuli]